MLMKVDEPSLCLRKLDHLTVRLRVHVTRELGLRLWLTKQLAKLLTLTLTGSAANLKFTEHQNVEELDDPKASTDDTATQKNEPFEPSIKNPPPISNWHRLIPDKDIKLIASKKYDENLWQEVHQNLWLQHSMNRTAQNLVPIPMLLFCPKCNLQHVDEAYGDWNNPPHRSHLCDYCGYVWRVADVPTTGVLSLQTRGQRDGIARPDLV